MKNTKTSMSSTMSKLGALVVMGVTLMLGGCASTKGLDTLNVEKSIKDKSGYVFGIKAGTKSVSAICDAFVSANDDRCKHPADYTAINVLIVDYRLTPKAPHGVVALVPNSIGDIPHTGIVKLRLDGFRPAYFEGLVAPYHNVDKECYYSNSASHSGVVCPKYNWDYRKDLEL